MAKEDRNRAWTSTIATRLLKRSATTAGLVLLADVNLFVQAHRLDGPHHRHAEAWLREHLHGREPLGIWDEALSSFVRIVTSHRIFRDPTALRTALAFCDAMRSAPATLRVTPTSAHWSVFSDLCEAVDARGNVIPDAFLAALAIENGADLVTFDAGFRRFPRLRLELLPSFSPPPDVTGTGVPA
jgi:toxin-antitoxin system PIN domain toxin